jgi:hypothetical protein
MEADDLADTIETSAGGLIAELGAVRDSVEELYILLDHIWRNRDELRDIIAKLLEDKAERDDDGEAVACCQCNSQQPSLAAAVRKGWKDFQCDDGDDWAYLAVCLDCQRKQTQDDRQRATLAAEMGLTPKQVQQARDEGVNTALGLRRIEKNTRSEGVCPKCQGQEKEVPELEDSQADNQKHLFV